MPPIPANDYYGSFHRDLIFGDEIAREAERFYASTPMSAEERVSTVARMAARLAVQRTWAHAEQIIRRVANETGLKEPSSSALVEALAGRESNSYPVPPEIPTRS